MTNRLIIPLLCAASAVAFARGTTGHKATLAASSSERGSRAALTSKFTVNASSGVEFTLDVRNNTSKMVELRFPDGRTHDFIVQDAGGKEVWRWSKSRMFTQGVQNKLVKSKDVAVFSENWDSAKMHGHFTALAVLASDNHPIEERVEFELK
jgi:Intracellular proteinase inhibitor